MIVGRSIGQGLSSLRATLLRWGSVLSGFYLEYREVFRVGHAQTILVILGIWLMAVPPAQWLDQLNKVSAAAKLLTSDEEEKPKPPKPPEGS